MKIFGCDKYTVIPEASPESPYCLEGPRGARLHLYRHSIFPQYLYAVNGNKMIQGISKRNFTWFLQKGSILYPITRPRGLSVRDIQKHNKNKSSQLYMLT